LQKVPAKNRPIQKFILAIALAVARGYDVTLLRPRQEKFLWWPYLFLLMPDHVHALLSAFGKIFAIGSEQTERMDRERYRDFLTARFL
jgi:hypothetical protein